MGTILFCVLNAYCDIFSLFMQISPENCLIYLKKDKYKKKNKYKKQFRVVKHDDSIENSSTTKTLSVRLC